MQHDGKAGAATQQSGRRRFLKQSAAAAATSLPLFNIAKAANKIVRIGYIDQFTGTLEPGKMADVVIWNGTPFSVYALAEQVFVDGQLAWIPGVRVIRQTDRPPNALIALDGPTPWAS